jgi:hypothetical protein
MNLAGFTDPGFDRAADADLMKPEFAALASDAVDVIKIPAAGSLALYPTELIDCSRFLHSLTCCVA